MKVSPARIAAFDALSRIERDRAFSSVVLPEYESGLSPADRSLCHLLVLGVLRRLIYLDKVIDHYAGGRRLDLPVRTALRLGIFQLRFLDRVPDHSAVNESVGLVQRARKTSAKGLVNAILRKTIREAFEPSVADELSDVSIRTSHPLWLLERWARQFGKEEAAELAAANNEPPEIAFRYTSLAEETFKIEPSRASEMVDGCFISPSMTPQMVDAADKGEIYFQDEGSQLVGSVASAVGGRYCLDVCAAPGSKTTQVAGSARGLNGFIIAGDRHPHRAAFLKNSIRNQRLSNVAVIVYDAEDELPFRERAFDTVLVDAPCSGTGTIKHNPEIRYFLDPADFSDLSNKQRRILQNASKMVRGGGTLIYSTCSLEWEENESIADWFSTTESAFELVRPPLGEKLIQRNNTVRTFPHRDGTDGFFVAVFRRRPV